MSRDKIIEAIGKLNVLAVMVFTIGLTLTGAGVVTLISADEIVGSPGVNIEGLTSFVG